MVVIERATHIANAARRWPRSKIRRRYRELMVAIALGLSSCAAIASSSRTPSVDGTFFDLAAFLVAHGSATEPVLVVALDQDSLTADELKAQPRAFFSPWLGEMTNALFAAGVRAIGLDPCLRFRRPHRSARTTIGSSRMRSAKISRASLPYGHAGHCCPMNGTQPFMTSTVTHPPAVMSRVRSLIRISSTMLTAWCGASDLRYMRVMSNFACRRSQANCCHA